VGPSFDGESIEVRLDGEALVAGSWVPAEDNDDHECPDPYELMLESGTHEIDVVTGSGATLIETFDLASEAHAIMQYRDPEAWPELSEPTIVWMIEDGAPVCM
jgi:hypothetical protein